MYNLGLIKKAYLYLGFINMLQNIIIIMLPS